MTQNDFLNTIIVPNLKLLYAIVGPNSSGKTYTLEYLYENLSTKVIYIDENGLVRTKDPKSKVSISGDYYIYTDEKKRGNSANDEMDVITDKSKSILRKIKSLLNRSSTKYISLGSQKINNILNVFLTYNLNNIDYLLFDEPENALDDKNLKLIKELLVLLYDEGIKTVFVTHSPRLLEIMQVEIKNIYVISHIKSNLKRLSFEDVYAMYDGIANRVQTIRSSTPPSEADKLEFAAPEPFKNIYIKNLLTSQDFYRILFYRDVLILEGLTEKYAVNEAQSLVDYSKNTFFSNGKYKTPFLIKLFSYYCQNVICIIDEDGNSSNLKNFSFLINGLINEVALECRNVKIKKFCPDIEGQLEIDVDQIIKSLCSLDALPSGKYRSNFLKKYKPYVLLHAIQTNPSLISKLSSTFIEYEF